MKILLILILSSSAQAFDVMDAMINPASMDYILYHDILTSDNPSPGCACPKKREVTYDDLSDAAKARIKKREEEVKKSVEEFKSSNLFKSINPNRTPSSN